MLYLTSTESFYYEGMVSKLTGMISIPAGKILENEKSI